MKITKKYLSVLLCLVMALSAVPSSLVALAGGSDIVITYNANGGTNAPEETACDYDEYILLSKGEGMTNGELKLLGWETDPKADYPNYIVGGGCSFTNDVTLYAIWGLDYDLIYGHPMFNCSEENNEITIWGYKGNKKSPSVLEIPTSIGGAKVVEVNLYGAPQKKIKIPDTVRSIGISGDKLEEIYIGKSVKEIGSAMVYAQKLKKITVSSQNPYFTVKDGVLYNKKVTKLICYPSGKKGSTYTVPKTVKNIDAFDTYNNETIFVKYEKGSKLGVTVGNVSYNLKKTEVKSVNKNAKGKITLPKTVKTLAYNTFKYCTKITEVSIPKGVKDLTPYTFEGCKKLKKVTLPSGLKTIGRGAFIGTVKLTSVKIPKSVKSIGEYAFSYSGVKKVELPSSITDIAYGAFINCKSLASVKAPNKLIKIGANAFKNTKWLKSQKGDFTSVGKNLISYNKKIKKSTKNKTVKVPEGTLSIADGVFHDAAMKKIPAVKSIVLPESVKYIAADSFYCPSLKSINIGSKVKEINTEFYGCENLTVKVEKSNKYALKWAKKWKKNCNSYGMKKVKYTTYKK